MADRPIPPVPRQASFLRFNQTISSFENLVALANYEESLKEARKIVWRDKGELPAELDDLWECAVHAQRGGIRASGLAFALRSVVNLILLLTRIRRAPKEYRFSLIRHALFGPDSFRFAAMLGTFVALYKFILNTLPIVLPSPPSHQRKPKLLPSSHLSSSDSPFDSDEESLSDPVPSWHQSRQNLLNQQQRQRDARLSISAQAHQTWVRKKTRRWYAILAGTLAGSIAILCERRDRRIGIGQQMFVRGLQGAYNAFSEKRGFRIPHGDVIVFALCSAQIMYSFLLRPDTLDKSYVSWIQTASKVPPEAVSINRDMVRTGTFKSSDIKNLLNRHDTTPRNASYLTTLLSPSSSNLNSLSTAPFAPCETVHPFLDSCLYIPFERFYNVFKWILPIYGVLHYVPLILFKRGVVLKEPWRMLSRAGLASMRSSAFLGVFVVIYQSFFCFKHNVHHFLHALPTSSIKHPILNPLLKLLRHPFLLSLPSSRLSFYFTGLLCGLSLFVEHKSRREELAMYVLPKGLESAYVMVRGKGLGLLNGRKGSKGGRLPGWERQAGELMLSGIGMGMVMGVYQNDPQHLSSLVRRILYQFVGPN